MKRQRVAAILTCHNRREHTLRCLDSILAAGFDPGDPNRRIYLCDDGSSDGTAEAVHARHSDTVIVRGSGSLFWAGGMRKAMATAAPWRPHWWWWVNDDTTMKDGAWDTLYRTALELQRPAILVGTCQDPKSGAITYGGWRPRHPRWPLAMERVEPGNKPKRCLWTNGNCALIHETVVRATGGIEPIFRHGMGDFALSFKARRMGFDVLVAPGTLATCEANQAAGRWSNKETSRHKRLSILMSPKGLPPRQWWHLCRMANPVIGPVIWAKTYVKSLVR